MTSTPVFTGAALYGDYCKPVTDPSAPPFSGPDGVSHTRPVCHVLFNFDNADAWARDTVDLSYVLPIGVGPHSIARDDLGQIVAVLDQGGRIALLGTHDEAVHQAISAILEMTGGSRA